MTHESEPASQQAIIEGYEALLACTRRMLASAREADWSALIEQEGDYVIRVERQSRLDARVELDTDNRYRKTRLLEQILENDLEIRKRLIERRDELGRLIGTTRRQRELQRTYGIREPAAAQAPATRFAKRSP